MSENNFPLSGSSIFTAIREYTKEPVEVEFKLKTDVKKMIVLLESFKSEKDISLEQTTNSLHKSNENINFVMSKDYKTGKISKRTKQRIFDAQVYDFPELRLTISIERDVDIMPKTEPFMFRIKNRLSVNRFPWRYDFTQVIEISRDISFDKNSIRIMAEKLFGKLEKLSGEKLIDGFITSCANPIIQRFELEIELIDDFAAEHVNSHSFLNSLGENKSLIKNTLYMDLMLQSIAVFVGMRISPQLSLKKILPSAETLTRVEYNKIFPPVDYYITKKADGERSLLLQTDTGIIFLINNKLEQLNDLENVHSGGLFKFNTILEGEIMEKNEFLPWDCLCLNGESLLDMRFSDRIAKIAIACSYFAGIKNLPIKVVSKPIMPITADLHTSFKQIMESKFPYPADGFVMISPDKGYMYTTSYKIKKSNTIDFLTIKLPTQFFSKLPLKKEGIPYLLFCSTNQDTMDNLGIQKLEFYNTLFGKLRLRGRIPIQFSPSDDPYAYIWYVDKATDKLLTEYSQSKNNPLKPSWAIVELELSGANWKLIKIRDDRYNEPNYFGNDLTRVATINWLVSKNPLDISEMHLGVNTYFNKGKDSYYFAQTSAMSFAKSKLFDIVKQNLPAGDDKLRIVDCAIGKGQDLNRYVNIGTTNLLGIDIDKTALLELVTRYYKKIHDKHNSIKMNISVLPQDMTENHSVITEKIHKLWADKESQFVYPNAVICNLAMHYFIRTIDELTNFVSFVKSMLPKDGIFMYTTFNGLKVFNLIAKTGEWSEVIDGVTRYKITRKYKNTQFGEFGQTIGVKLPFTDDDMYDENLVNNAFINSAFGEMGFKVVKEGSFADFLPLFKSENAQVYNLLNHADKQFIDLYYYAILVAK
jgi:hypothetical protein